VSHADSSNPSLSRELSDCASDALSRYARIWRIVEVQQRIFLDDAPDAAADSDASAADGLDLTPYD
jgi:hypothetical protein